MVSNPDLADVVTQAATSGAKVILAGIPGSCRRWRTAAACPCSPMRSDTPSCPSRSGSAAWEQAASLRLRDGDASVLAEYDQHGRIRGGEPEQMMDAAAAAYLALTLTEAFRFDHFADMQEAILARTNASLITGLSVYLEGLAEADPPEQLTAIFEKSQAASRGLLLSGPFTLPLPTLPRATGEAEDFARLIRDRLEEFRSHWPLFKTLLTPVTLTFLVIPPEQGKDLDNIALTALPIAHDVLRPHIAPHLLTGLCPSPDEACR